MLEIVRPGTTYQMFADIRCHLNKAYETAYNRFMESVYQNTFWLIVALLAVLLPLFVLAVSLLGRAIGIAREQKRKIEVEQEQKARNETKEATSELEKGETDAARKRLNLAKREEEEATKRLKRVDKRYDLLTLRCCVIVPGAFLVVAAVLSAVAGSLGSGLTGLGSLFWIALSSWTLSLVFIGVAVSRLIRALSVVQEVSLSTDELALQHTKEALKTALLEVEEAKRPELEFTWKCAEIPVRVKRSEIFEIEHSCRLSRGDVARSIRISIHAPPGFGFKNQRTVVQDADHPAVPSYITADTFQQVLTRGIATTTKTKIVAPAEDGEHTLFAVVYCEGFQGETVPLEVVVAGELVSSEDT